MCNFGKQQRPRDRTERDHWELKDRRYVVKFQTISSTIAATLGIRTYRNSSGKTDCQQNPGRCKFVWGCICMKKEHSAGGRVLLPSGLVRGSRIANCYPGNIGADLALRNTEDSWSRRKTTTRRGNREILAVGSGTMKRRGSYQRIVKRLRSANGFQSSLSPRTGARRDPLSCCGTITRGKSPE